MPQQTQITPLTQRFSRLGGFVIRHLMALLALSAFTAQAATPRAAEDMDSPVMSSDAPFQRFANPKSNKAAPIVVASAKPERQGRAGRNARAGREAREMRAGGKKHHATGHGRKGKKR